MKVSLKQFLKILIVLFFFLFLFAACKKPEQYPIIPLIEFKSYQIQSSNGIDSNLVLTFSFKDGDGDIGFPDDDSVHKSIHVYYYKKKDGEFYLRVKPEDAFNFDVKLPMILNTGVKRPIKGDIEYSINISIDVPIIYQYDTVYVAFTLEDRAFNISNMITSPEIVLKRKL